VTSPWRDPDPAPDQIGDRQGRLTINPAKHIDPIGAVAFVIAALVGQDLFL